MVAQLIYYCPPLDCYSFIIQVITEILPYTEQKLVSFLLPTIFLKLEKLWCSHNSSGTKLVNLSILIIAVNLI